jgi:hypothetical protein
MKQDVNYIKHLNTINQKFFESDLDCTDISLYNALFQLWNNCGFDDKMSINRNDVMNLSKIGSVNTYLKGLKRLDELKFLKYMPSHNPLKGSIINLFRFDTSCDNLVIKFNTTSDTTTNTSTDTTSDTLYKLNKLLNNETIKLINDNASLLNNNLEKWIKDSKNKSFNFKKSLLEICSNENLVNDWLLVRKNKKATNTQTAFNSFIEQVKISDIKIDEILKICVEKSWSGYKFEWILNERKKVAPKKESKISQLKSISDELDIKLGINQNNQLK